MALLPRPETEELVQWVIDDNNTNDKKKLIDLGAGSGCIGISISKTISLDVTLADISKEALRECNINKDMLDSNVKIIGMGTGFCYSKDGPTHHSLEDIGVLRNYKNINIFLIIYNHLIYY